MIGGIKCPNMHGEMALKRIEKETIFKGENINYSLETYACDKCEIEIGTIEQTAAAQNAIADAYRKKNGLLTGEEIKEKRVENGWSQKDLADKAGVGVASIKRWESGNLQTKSMDQALRSAFQGIITGNSYTGNREEISIPRIKAVFTALEKRLGFKILIPDDKLLFAAKYLWYVDMLSFRELGKSITGATYARLPYGPQLNNYNDIVELLPGASEADADPLTANEIRIINRIAITFSRSQMVYDAAHREAAWQKRSMGSLIPYTAAEELTEI